MFRTKPHGPKAKNDPTVEDIMASLEKVAPQAKRLATLPRQKLNEQLKRIAGKRVTMKHLDQVSHFIDIIRRNLMTDKDEGGKLDMWAEKARHEAVKNLERFVSEGSLIKAEELIDQLGWTRQALSKARKTRRVFSVEIKGEPYYPAFFADPQYERRQLEAVSKVLGDLPGTSKLQFMLTPKGSLNALTPLEALAKGKLAEVKITAEGFVRR